MAYLAAINWPALALFAALMLTIAMFGLSYSGHFPAEHQAEKFKTLPGRLVMVGTVLVIAICAAKMLGLAIAHVPPPAAIIAGGAALLVAPLVLQNFPDSFVDGRRGLIALAAAAALLTVLAGKLVV